MRRALARRLEEARAAAATFADTRAALHTVAEGIIAPSRLPPDEISLRWTRGGFGTPFFEREGKDCQVRVEHGELVRQVGKEESREGLPDVDVEAATALGDFYGLACAVLEQLRAVEADGDPSLVRLWPEHFDIAFELGSEAKGQRAHFGASPGDDDHPEPYFYVSPGSAEVSGELWNATGFKGAELTYSGLIAADDQRRAALEFMAERYSALQEATS